MIALSTHFFDRLLYGPPDMMWRTASHSLLKGLSYALLDVYAWRDYHRHSFARQHCADPSTEGLADQQRRRKISEEDSRRDEQERAKNHEFWAWKARNLSAWAPRGMG